MAKIGSAFDRTSARPIDKDFGLTKAQMRNVNENLMPDVYPTFCPTDGKMYLYYKLNPVDPETGRYRLFESGSGSASNPFELAVVQELPASGATGTIYLVPNGDTGSNQYTEYIWVDGDPAGRFELLGTVEIDLSNYYDKDEIDALLAAQTGAGLSEALTSSKVVGGIAAGTSYPADTPVETILRDMLNPTENPTLTAPSATLSAAGGTLVEEGVPTDKTLTATLNRGSISPAYGTSGFRAGEATGYALNGGEQQAGNTFIVTVDESNKTFVVAVSYAAGEQPKNSKGEDFSSPLEAGSVNSNTLVFEIVAPIWSNAANIATIAKESLLSRTAKQKQFNFPAQTTANPEVFDIPAAWTVTAVEVLNTLSNQWVDCAVEFTVTDVTHGEIAYKRYTYNSVATGARSVRVKWS